MPDISDFKKTKEQPKQEEVVEKDVVQEEEAPVEDNVQDEAPVEDKPVQDEAVLRDTDEVASTESADPYKVSVLRNCSTCALSTWDPEGKRDNYMCNNQSSPYLGQTFCRGITYAKEAFKCWRPRASYVVGERLKGDALAPKS